MKILDGKKIAGNILRNLKREIEKKRLKLRLAVVCVGEDPASKIFVREKQKACEFVGISFKLYKFPAKISPVRLKKEIKKIIQNSTISGVVIQLPLPKNLNSQEILNLVPSEKDVDVLSEKSIAKFYTGTLPIFPPMVGGISRFLKEYKIPTKSRNIVLIGAGKLVVLPSAFWLLREKATVSIVNEFTKNISSFTQKADIIISGVGKPNLITGKMVRRGQVIIDAGISLKKEKLTGDIDFKTVSKKASYITPVPGGIGPVTVACLLENLVKLNEN